VDGERVRALGGVCAVSWFHCWSADKKVTQPTIKPAPLFTKEFFLEQVETEK